MYIINGFNDMFNINNWTLTPEGGSIDTANAPNYIILYNADNNNGIQNTTAVITSPVTGIVSFDWDVTNVNSYFSLYWDPLIFIVNDTNITLTDDYSYDGNGHFQYNINAGDVFGFNAKTLDSLDGYFKNTISNFRFEENTVIINNGNQLLNFMNSQSTYGNITNSLEINNNLVSSTYKVLTGDNISITKTNN